MRLKGIVQLRDSIRASASCCKVIGTLNRTLNFERLAIWPSPFCVCVAEGFCRFRALLAVSEGRCSRYIDALDGPFRACARFDH